MRFTIIGNYGVGNLGDDAILLGLKTLILQKYSTAKIDVLGKNSHMPLGFRSFFKSIFVWSMWMKPLATIKLSDKCIIGGGGLFTDEESFTGSILWSLHGIIVSKFLKKEVLCLGVSVGPMSFVSRFFTKAFLIRCSTVVVRDLESNRILNSWGVKSIVAPDLALAISHDKGLARQVTKDEKYILINLRSFGDSDIKLINVFVQFVDFLVTDFGYRVNLVSLKSGTKSDSLILNNLFDQLSPKSKSKTKCINATIVNIVNLISNADLFITMRLHGGVIATLTDTPVIPISYMKKVDEFWSTVDPTYKVLPVKSLTFDKLKDYFLKAIPLTVHKLGVRKKYIENSTKVLSTNIVSYL